MNNHVRCFLSEREFKKINEAVTNQFGEESDIAKLLKDLTNSAKRRGLNRVSVQYDRSPSTIRGTER